MTNAEKIAKWIETHPFLAPIGALESAVEAAATRYAHQSGTLARWTRTAEEVESGIPLLESRSANPAVFVEAGRLLASLTECVLGSQVPPKLQEGCRALQVQLRGDDRAGERLVRQALNADAAGSAVASFLAWRAMARVLEPLVRAPESDAQWNRNRCPTCGALPAMAQLRQTGRGRERVLSCGRCATTWSYRRVGCPYCANESLDQLGVLEPENEPGFRIDVCRRCKGYLKTHTADGDETLALADWTTLHLDAVASQNGFERLGPSLYAL